MQVIFYNSSITVIFITSGDNCHCNQIVKTIKNNKHIFVEETIFLFFHEGDYDYGRLHKITEGWRVLLLIKAVVTE